MMVSPRKSSHPKELNSHPIGSVYGICIYIYIFFLIYTNLHAYTYTVYYTTFGTGAVRMPGETYQSQNSLGHMVPFVNCIYSDHVAK